MKAAPIYEGGATVLVPEEMGTPCADQMRGTAAERLSELAARVCYDSLGLDEAGKRRGRSSVKLHEHLLETRNHNPYEHFHFTVRLERQDDPADRIARLVALLNRPGVRVSTDLDTVTTNLRAVLEWDRHAPRDAAWAQSDVARRDAAALRFQAHHLAPAVVALRGDEDDRSDSSCVEPTDADTSWLSLFLSGSRGLSHEQVRHHWECSVSQRSTRYVDESESPWIEHPLTTAFLDDESAGVDRAPVRQAIDRAISAGQEAYRAVADALEKRMRGAGVDATGARKQARGAGRGYLGNALLTEMVFSASATQWLWMLDQRASRFADAEIRAIYVQVLPILQGSLHGRHFAHLTLVPSPDGIGQVLANVADVAKG